MMIDLIRLLLCKPELVLQESLLSCLKLLNYDHVLCPGLLLLLKTLMKIPKLVFHSVHLFIDVIDVHVSLPNFLLNPTCDQLPIHFCIFLKTPNL
jgi:hypothetical protein